LPEPNTDFYKIAAGDLHNLGLRSDGTIVAWGYNGIGSCDVPEPNAHFVAVAAGGDHSLGVYDPTGVRIEEPWEPDPGQDHQRTPTVRVINYPNPFNPQTTISFSLGRSEWAKIGVYDLGGRLLSVLADRTYDAGHHTIVWYGNDAMGRVLPSGSYVVRLETESAVETQKVSLIR